MDLSVNTGKPAGIQLFGCQRITEHNKLVRRTEERKRGKGIGQKLGTQRRGQGKEEETGENQKRK